MVYGKPVQQSMETPTQVDGKPPTAVKGEPLHWLMENPLSGQRRTLTAYVERPLRRIVTFSSEPQCMLPTQAPGIFGCHQ